MMRATVILLAAAMALGACSLTNPYSAPSRPQSVPQPAPGSPPSLPPEPQPQAPESAPQQPPPAPTREYGLGTASRALVTQAQMQTKAGNYDVAAASIERALRIEPGNPLLWLELGKVRQAERNYAQAENMARKALSLGTGDRKVHAAGWRLIAESLWARGRGPEAREAELRAES